MRIDDVRGFDFTQTNRYRWRAEYEGVELGLAHNRHLWKPLADPLEIFVFDFYDMQQNSTPSERAIDFPVTESGVFNAVAFWFELQVRLLSCAFLYVDAVSIPELRTGVVVSFVFLKLLPTLNLVRFVLGNE